MSDLEHRLKHDMEPVLSLADPRERISAYHDMPYAIFHYEPDEEFDLRKQVTLLETRLTQSVLVSSPCRRTVDLVWVSNAMLSS